MSTITMLTKKLAADKLGVAPDCVWGEALERFNEKRVRLYAQCIMPLTGEDEYLLNKAILPYYEALRVLFPMEVQKEISFRQIEVKQGEKPPALEPAPAPVETKPKASPSPAKPIVITLPKWNLRTFTLIFIRVFWKSLLLFPGFAVGLAALFVTAFWKYFLIANVFDLSIGAGNIALLPILSVITVEGAKIFAVVMPEYWKTRKTSAQLEQAKAITWLQISIFVLSAIAAAGLIGAYVSNQYNLKNAPSTAAIATVNTLAEMSGCSQNIAIMVVALLIAITLDLCIYALLSSAAYGILHAKPVQIRNDGDEQSIVELPKAGIIFTMVCLTVAAIWSISKYSDKAHDYFFTLEQSNTNLLIRPVRQDSLPPTELYATIGNLKVRKKPGLNGEVVATLNLYETVYYLHEKTEEQEEINPGNEKATDYWVKIRTQSGQEGWVFGAGVHYYKTKRME